MPASYPTSAKSFTTKSDGPGNTILAAYVNDLQAEVTAVETDLIAGLPLGRGGTGLTSLAANRIPYSSGSAFTSAAGFTFDGTTLTAPAAAFTGVVTKSAQPAFLAKATAQSNVTGDGTLYTVLFATESFDQANNFASPTFTAPVTGKYLLSCQVALGGLTTSHADAYIELLVGGVSHYSQFTRTGEYVANDTWTATMCILIGMTAADTAVVKAYVSGGTKVVDINAVSSFFSGYLAC